MTTTSDTPDLDEKKQSNSQKSTQKMDFKGFVLSLISLLVVFFVYFSFSSFNLYAAKLTQSNILPTDLNCFPYTTNDPTIEPITSNIFYTSVPSLPPQSMKLQFDPPSKKHIFLDMLRNHKSPTQHFLANYLILLFESLFQFNYSSFTMYFNSLNTLPETACVLFSPIITVFFILFMLFVEFFYFIFLWFQCMTTFFQSTNDKDEKIPITLFGDPINYMISIGFVFLFMIILFLIVAFIPILNVGIFIACILSMIGYIGHFLGKNNGIEHKKRVNLADMVKGVFIYYKGIITSIFSLFFINNIFTYLGNIPGIISIFVAILLYFGKLGIPFFQAVPPNLHYLSNIIETHKATKTCAYSNPSSKSKSIFASLFGYPSSNTQQSGGHFAKTLKIPVLDKKFLKSFQTI